MLAKTLSVFQAVSAIDAIVVIVPPGDEAYCRDEIVERYGLSKVTRIVAGGATRQESVACGLRALGRDVTMAVIHDAARPFVMTALLERVIDAAAASGAAIAALPVVDTLKRRSPTDGGAITVDRDGLWTAQTPQAFRHSLLIEAYERAAADGFIGTDDASLVERLGQPVTLVEGHPTNIKITTPDDFQVAAELLSLGVVSWGGRTDSGR
jgi:2-C-methyl-D-erythritol 4-phosphate cytidylyltransferase